MATDHPRDSFLQRLSDGARIRGRYARMLPEDRTPTDGEIEQACNAIVAYMRSRRVSNKDLSRELGDGFAPSTISQVLSGKYEGDRVGKLRAMLTHIQHQCGAEDVPWPSHLVETEAVKYMVRSIDAVHRLRAIGVIAAPAGFGKTTVLEAVATKKPGTILVRVLPSNSTPVGLIKLICHAIDQPYRRSTEALLASLDKLRGSKRLMLIDEAHRLRPQALEVVRDFCDAGVAIVLAGAPQLIQMINDTEQGSQFYSRCASVINIGDYISPEGGEGGRATPMITVEDVLRICAADKLTFTGEAQDLLFRIANAPGLGSLRTCQRLVQMVAQVPAARTRPITEADLWKALREIKGATYNRMSRDVVARSRQRIKFA